MNFGINSKTTTGIKGVIFDVDGVLVNTESSRFKFLCQLTNKFNLKLTDSDFAHMIGKTTKDFLVGLKSMPEGVFDTEFWPIFEDKYLRNIGDYLAPIPTCIDFIKTYPKSKKYAVASNNLSSVIHKILDKLEISRRIDVVISREDVKLPKPNPDIYLMAAQKLGLLPEECICVEDSFVGAKAAIDAKVKCHIFLNGNNSTDEFATISPSSYFKTTSELLKIVYG